MGVLLHPFKGGGGFKIFFEEGGVGSVEVEGASGVVFAEAGSGKDVEDVWIGYTFFSFGINELLLAGDGTKGGDENDWDTTGREAYGGGAFAAAAFLRRCSRPFQALSASLKVA